MQKPNKKSLKWFIISLVTVVMTWGLVVPALEFPDEQAHLGTVSYLAREGYLPGYQEPDMTVEMTEVQKILGTLRDSQGRNKYTYHPEYNLEYSDSLIGKYEHEIALLNNVSDRTTYTNIEEAARYPILYYLYGSIFWKIANNGTLIDRIFAVRLGGILIAALMTYISFNLGLLIFNKRSYAYILASITIIQPMFSFVTAGINSDNLHNLLFMYAIYLGMLVVKQGITLKRLALMLGTLIADLYTKPQGFIMIPILVLALFIRVVREKQYRLLIYIVLLVLATAILGWGQIEKYSGFLNIANTRGASFIDYLHFSANKLLAQNVVWYWGVFKWLGVVLPPIYWRVANRVALLSVVGLAVYFIKMIKKKYLVVDPISVFYLVLVAIIYALVIFWFDWQYVKGWGFSLGIQARYFFPTLLAHMSLLLIGLTSFGWNAISRKYIRNAVFILFLWLQIGGLWTLLQSYYDLSSLKTFITQASQYKPWFAKGNWWYLWLTGYLASVIYLAKQALKPTHSV